MYDVRAIGNWFLDRAARDGEQLTAMKLQKLAYVAHGWHLALTGRPLAHDAVEAWKWGPVFRSLYREFREYGADPIESRAMAFDGADLVEKEIGIDDYSNIDPSVTKPFLDNVWDLYGKYSAGQLSDITHRKDTPWHKMYTQMGNRILPFAVISNELIAEHYEKLLNERTNKAHSES